MRTWSWVAWTTQTRKSTPALEKSSRLPALSPPKTRMSLSGDPSPALGQRLLRLAGGPQPDGLQSPTVGGGGTDTVTRGFEQIAQLTGERGGVPAARERLDLRGGRP